MSNKTIEELIQLAKRQLKKKDKKLSKLSSVTQYKIQEKVNPGTELVSALVVFDSYIKWAYLNNEVPLTKIMFFKEFKLHFKKKTNKDGVFYLLDSVGFNLTSQHRQMLIEEHKKSKGFSNEQKKKNKEIYKKRS